MAPDRYWYNRQYLLVFIRKIREILFRNKGDPIGIFRTVLVFLIVANESTSTTLSIHSRIFHFVAMEESVLCLAHQLMHGMNADISAEGIAILKEFVAMF